MGASQSKGIVGVGVDIIHVPRLVALLRRRPPNQFARRILSETELARWNSIRTEEDAERTRYLAVRWSVKEAAYKALYPTAQPTWKQLSFYSPSKDGASKPTLVYHSDGPQSRLWRFHTSVSHDGEYVMATVIVESS
ncbi:4'-phosphopantetheinyl transferase [Pilatotrama ljubarskyi]|nr:4'-phosphopantetheinyl transferase [Pilatotrama ljubarskyi]